MIAGSLFVHFGNICGKTRPVLVTYFTMPDAVVASDKIRQYYAMIAMIIGAYPANHIK
jgi:hypothetical protein